MNLNMPSDFMQDIIIRKYLSRMNIFLCIFYLLQFIYLLLEQKLNHRNYSKQEIIVNIFVQTTEHEILMYAKFGEYNYFIYLQLITSRIYL